MNSKNIKIIYTAKENSLGWLIYSDIIFFQKSQPLFSIQLDIKPSSFKTSDTNQSLIILKK
jgi:hypothetical protein